MSPYFRISSLEKIPGCFGFLGAGDGLNRTAQGLHHPRFDVCEQALAWGAAVHVQLVRDRAANLGAKPAP